MLFSELKQKDVINMRNCEKLGHVCDLEFDECTGKICKFFVPDSKGILCNLLKCEPDRAIPCKDVKQIGPDIILVDIGC